MTPFQNFDERRLLTKIRDGDEAAFRQVYERYYQRLCVFAFRYIKDQEACKDIVNDVFLKSWKNPKHFDQAEHLLASLYASTRNAALNYSRSHIRAMERDFTFQDERGEADTFYLREIMHTEMLNELHAAIARLPQQARKIVEETYIQGRSNQEVAEEMGISIQTLRNQKSRALTLLRGLVKRESFELLIAGGILSSQF